MSELEVKTPVETDAFTDELCDDALSDDALDRGNPAYSAATVSGRG